MDERIRELIDRTKDEALRGATASRETILTLLAIAPDSEEAGYLGRAANEVAHAAAGGRARLAGAVGIDLCSCDMNCKFCSFGTKWGIVTEERAFTEDEIIDQVKRYVDGGATTITLRSTEFYDVNVLNSWMKDIRSAVPGEYEMNLNVGELTPASAHASYAAGVSCAYHVLRLREGVDTPFRPEIRLQTMRSIADSPLKLGTCVEPIGIEHTDDELADSILTALSFKPYTLGCMARINVPGTPFGGVQPVSTERMIQLIAVTRLAAGTSVEYVEMHPADPRALRSGANSVVVEMGANPRDVDFNEGEWMGLSVPEGKRMLEDAGFEVRLAHCDPRFRAGETWWEAQDAVATEEVPERDGQGSFISCCGRRMPLEVDG